MPNVIEYNNVMLCRDDVTILKDVNFAVEEGQLMFVTGKVGSGKTTLLQSMYAQLPLSSGSASVLGYDLAGISPRDIPRLRRQLGIVFQDFRLLDDRDVLNNLKFVLRATGWTDPDEIDKRVVWALKQVGQTNKAYSMSRQLSGGEQQCVAIARALVNDPKIIIADEPTGNLDQETAFTVMDLLQRIAKSGTTVIVATHNTAIIDRYPAARLECDNGTVRSL